MKLRADRHLHQQFVVTAKTFRLGVIGAGGFGLFALQHFLQVPGVELAGMACTHREAALAMAKRFGLSEVQEVEALLQRPEIDLIYIATPPFLHCSQALQALNAGKHVLCEKPLALTLEQAEQMISVARQRGLLLVSNLMQRYNPLFDQVKRLIESQVLGECLHGYFENYATDEGLPPTHWFWDRTKSGGIFIEHGVHFFDLFAGWLGAGQVLAGQRTLRPGSGFEEQVQCTVRYPNSVLVNFYHGFTQPARLEHQECRLLFERGEIILEEWIPVRARIRAVADEGGTRELMGIFREGRLDITAGYGGQERIARGRHKTLDLYQKFEIRSGCAELKMHRYGKLLRSLFEDQLRWVQDRNHPRKVTEQNGLDSLAMAMAATRLAEVSG